jgi:hypothetical protein
MKRLLTVTYGAASYLVGLAAFRYAIGFVGNIAVPRSIDQGVAAPIAEAIVVNALLLGAHPRHSQPPRKPTDPTRRHPGNHPGSKMRSHWIGTSAAAASPKTVVELRRRPSLESMTIIVTGVEAHHG